MRCELPDDCDAESELALTIPGAAGAGATELRERRGAFTLRCANRDIGGFTPGDGAAAPPAFWPTMYAEMPTHPALHRRVRETGRAPAQMEISYRQAPGAPTRRAWRLIGVEAVAVPYPLTDNLRNATAAALDALAPGAGQIGVAYSLPMPSAVERNQALVGRRGQMERIRRDFPDAFLPARP